MVHIVLDYEYFCDFFHYIKLDSINDDPTIPAQRSAAQRSQEKNTEKNTVLYGGSSTLKHQRLHHRGDVLFERRVVDPIKGHNVHLDRQRAFFKQCVNAINIGGAEGAI